MLAQLYEDKRKLKEIRSIETKIELKRKLLPNYEPYINGVLAGGKGAQDDVLMMVMLWRLDTKDFDGALVTLAMPCNINWICLTSFNATRRRWCWTALETFATKLGLAFQVHDDVLDVIGDTKKLGKQAGADAEHDKATYPALLGLEQRKS